jgi:hypothetical protein
LAAIPKKYPVGKNRRVYRTLLVWFERENCEDVVLLLQGVENGNSANGERKEELCALL